MCCCGSLRVGALRLIVSIYSVAHDESAMSLYGARLPLLFLLVLLLGAWNWADVCILAIILYYII